MQCDAANRARARRGEKLSWAKLTAADVRLIRALRRQARAQIAQVRSWGSERALAAKFGVHPNTIHNVLNYYTWRHVRDGEEQ